MSFSAASVTVWMNRIDGQLRRELDAPVFQTWNPCVEPAKERVLADQMEYLSQQFKAERDWAH